jgi:hypothetical protein
MCGEAKAAEGRRPDAMLWGIILADMVHRIEQLRKPHEFPKISQ